MLEADEEMLDAIQMLQDLDAEAFHSLLPKCRRPPPKKAKASKAVFYDSNAEPPQTDPPRE